MKPKPQNAADPKAAVQAVWNDLPAVQAVWNDLPAVQAVWNDLPHEIIRKSVPSFCKRLMARIKAEGKHFENLINYNLFLVHIIFH